MSRQRVLLLIATGCVLAVFVVRAGVFALRFVVISERNAKAVCAGRFVHRRAVRERFVRTGDVWPIAIRRVKADQRVKTGFAFVRRQGWRYVVPRVVLPGRIV